MKKRPVYDLNWTHQSRFQTIKETNHRKSERWNSGFLNDQFQVFVPFSPFSIGHQIFNFAIRKMNIFME